LKRKRIVIIIDDDIQASRELKLFLEEKGLVVFHIEDGTIAIQSIQDINPDIIVLDIIMPKIDGFTLAKQIRYEEKLKHIPIIISSAQWEMKELFAMEGLNDYITKPVDKAALLDLINKRIG
jgi:chemosensory pili system protein ChpA (sensor histidine kinase/response regulator)